MFAEIRAMLVWALQLMLSVVSMSTQLAALRRTEVRTLSKTPGFTRTSWQEFYTRCCNTSESLIHAEYTKAFRCPHGQNSRGLRLGDHAGQLTGPPRPVHCSPKVGFRFSLTMRRKRCAPPCRDHMCCQWCKRTCSKSTAKSFIKKTMAHCTC
jgi:hypothetical protein